MVSAPMPAGSPIVTPSRGVFMASILNRLCQSWKPAIVEMGGRGSRRALSRVETCSSEQLCPHVPRWTFLGIEDSNGSRVRRSASSKFATAHVIRIFVTLAWFTVLFAIATFCLGAAIGEFRQQPTDEALTWLRIHKLCGLAAALL